MPPPSSGGVLLIEMLNVLEGFSLRGRRSGLDPSHGRDHALRLCRPRAAARRSGFRQGADRGSAVEAICRDAARATSIANRASRRTRSPTPIRPSFEGNNTTHYSVVDRHGNAVANTYTLNLSYGVGLVAEGTGVLLNNELDDFAAAPGAPNAFGLVGYEANAPGPNKRPLSSMTPTIVLKDGRPFLVTGSPGGSRIITAVLQVLLNVIDHRMTIAEAVQAPRVHHQWLPDQMMAEVGMPQATVEALEARGHRVTVSAVHRRATRSW